MKTTVLIFKFHDIKLSYVRKKVTSLGPNGLTISSVGFLLTLSAASSNSLGETPSSMEYSELSPRNGCIRMICDLESGKREIFRLKVQQVFTQ